MPLRVCILSVAVFCSACSLSAASDKGAADRQIVPTHADAALIIAKYSGLFDRYGLQDATLNECVAFLNDHGIYFGLMEVVGGTAFTRKDCARVMGQISLLFSGDAEYFGGKVKLPKGVDSWEVFCIMNDVEYVEAYEAIQTAVSRTGEKMR